MSAKNSGLDLSAATDCCESRRSSVLKESRNILATIPKALHEHINTAFPMNFCLIAMALPDGFAQVSPRGSLMVFDDEHFAFWERSKGTTDAVMKDGAKITVFFRKPELRTTLLPKGAIARFYGTA